MNKNNKIILLGSVLVIAAMVFLADIFNPSESEPSASMDLQSVLGVGDNAGFKKVFSAQPISFPKDHGPHSDYKTEWWYFTGNLESETGEAFGYQLTFFRFGLSPDEQESESKWASNEVYMAHFALSEEANKAFYHWERFSRSGMELAGVKSSPFQVWLDDWRVEQTQGNQNKSCWGCLDLTLFAAHDDVEIKLELTSLKPAVLQGENGFSKKSQAAGNASMYYSLTRLATKGVVTINEKQFAVSGLSWMDREWSTSALAKEQAGWDWFSMHLDDGADLMYYQLRLRDGVIDSTSSGSLIDSLGNKMHLELADVELVVQDEWRSPNSNVVYPSTWKMSVPSQDLELEVTPVLADQELNLAFRYWEGAVRINGVRAGVKIAGTGFVELTGYAQ